MKHIKKVEVLATTREVVEYRTCDLCGERIMPPADPYAVEEVEIRYRSGHEYPDAGMGEDVTFDICGACFKKDLLPWLIAHGAAPNVEEWIW